jgi:hypothetical protein
MADSMRLKSQFEKARLEMANKPQWQRDAIREEVRKAAQSASPPPQPKAEKDR